MNEKIEYNLINGEALEELDKLIEKGIKVDAVICDPPYGTVKDISQDNVNIKHGMVNGNLSWDTALDPKILFEKLNKIVRIKGKIILFSQEPYSNELLNSLSGSSNIKFNYRMIWNKLHFANCLLAKKAPVSYYEDILVFSKEYDIERRNNKELRLYSKTLYDYLKEKNGFTNVDNFCKDNTGKYTTAHFFYYKSLQFKLCSEINYNILIDKFNIDKFDFFKTYEELKEINITPTATFNLPEGSKIKSNILEYKKDYSGFHPTQKPVALMEDLVYTYTNQGDTVLDFTMGSGSTGVACKNLNRKFIGIELDKDYFKIAEERINNI